MPAEPSRRHAPSPLAAAGRSGTLPHTHSTGRSGCTRCTPFFPARHTGLPDFVGQLQSRVAELEVDGSELLGLRHVHGPLYHLAHRRLDLRAKLLHDGLDALLTGFVGRSGKGTRSHDQLLAEESVWVSGASPKLPGDLRKSHPSISCTPVIWHELKDL